MQIVINAEKYSLSLTCEALTEPHVHELIRISKELNGLAQCAFKTSECGSDKMPEFYNEILAHATTGPHNISEVVPKSALIKNAEDERREAHQDTIKDTEDPNNWFVSPSSIDNTGAVIISTNLPKPPSFINCDKLAEDDEINECGKLIDSKGVEWDPNLHAKNKTKNKDGTWRLGNNKSPLPAPPPLKVIENTAFDTLMHEVNKKILANKLTPESWLEVLKTFGLISVPELYRSQDMIPTISAYIQSL